jgi:hypothetical protein
MALLLGTTKDRLEALLRDRENYISRRCEEINGKQRQLAVPTRKLRSIHERIKYHLNKIKQPPYLYSPRKGRGQRDNAAVHAGNCHVLRIDIRQFYPRTTQEDIFRWAYHTAGLADDVAGLFAKLVAVDGKMPFGSPVSPVLTSLVHRPMFDRVYRLCEEAGLTMSLWVDDLTISGPSISGAFLDQVRCAIREGGFQTHKIEFLDTARPVVITGVPIAQQRVLAPLSLHRRIQNEHVTLRAATSDIERAASIDRLLSALGTCRYHLGAATAEGRKIANRMHALKQRRQKLSISVVTMTHEPTVKINRRTPQDEALPWDA